MDLVDDGPGKPVGIQQLIGRHPTFAFGNSDGDLQMLQWTAAGGNARFMSLVHHMDAQRESGRTTGSRTWGALTKRSTRPKLATGPSWT